MIIFLNFTDRSLQVRFNNILDSNLNNHDNSESIIKLNFSDFGIEFRYINKILEESATIYARIINQYKFN